jgi:hypothetical protein
MKKTLTSAILMLFILTACKKEESNYASLIIGGWINTEIDGKPVPTDDVFVIRFRSDQVESYAKGFQLDSVNRSWIENDKYSYVVSGDLIVIDGVSDPGNRFHMEFRIILLDGQTLTYSVSKFLIDGVEYPDPKTYTSQRITTDLRSLFTGTWYGRCTTQGASDTAYHYWNYSDNGHFDYYYRDTTGQWINKPDNHGAYFVYGNFFASNYTNDLFSGQQGQAFECWNFTISGDTMSWYGLRQNNQVAGFRMEKVPAPPVVRSAP